MLFAPSAPAAPEWRDHLAKSYRADEDAVAAEILAEAQMAPDAKARVADTARSLVELVRGNRAQKGGIDAFMNEYDLSTQEGLVLMCLAEALLRIPDADTADKLIQDKLTGTDWEKHLGNSRSIFVNASTLGLMLTGRILRPSDLPADAPEGVMRRLTARLGEPVIRQALRQAMRIMGRQFVLGRTIKEAMERGKEQERKGYRYSYDMLGEAARTHEDALRYLHSYEQAIHSIGKAAGGKGPVDGPGISVKLSALHPRYELAKREEMLEVLAARTLDLAKLAKQYDIGFCIDAEESERLELSLEIIEKVYSDAALDGWEGFGLAVQAYQKRARAAIDVLAGMVRRVGRRMNVRLVKGAYWDTEIKKSQELGLSDYPVFTRKVATDVSYLACARKLLDADGLFYPQFATHNAHTAAAVMEMAEGKTFEFQRLHGMGEELYDEIVPHNKMGIPCRIYAPVGGHAELLSYLVRRLLENGANTSFVNRLVDDRTPVDAIIADPVERLASLASKRHPHIPLPRDIYGSDRRNARGLDLFDSTVLVRLDTQMENDAKAERFAGPIIGGEERRRDGMPITDPANRARRVGTVAEATAEEAKEAIERAQAAYPDWDATDPERRAAILETVADAMENRMVELMTICVREAGKTLPDAVAEVREAVDFLRYYANEVRRHFGKTLPHVDTQGRAAQVHLNGRGVFVCISPWNFPMAIFTGQVCAALGAGNAVIAKPAEQTPLIAAKVVRMFHAAGVPGDVLQLLPGRGETVGATLIADERVAGVAFTGSVEVAHIINRVLARRSGGPVPLIAETGGMNVMFVDSSALPEQVIRDVVLSAFGSAGQRCSALRVLYVQEEVADGIIAMLKGAMAELKIGDPGRLNTDVGPVIDEEAWAGLQTHADRMEREAKTLFACDLGPQCKDGSFFAPRAFEIPSIEVLDREVFGPVLHVARYKAADLNRVIDQVRATGYGLTMGIHTRIDAKARQIQAASRVGNTYVNRNMIGAVVGVQPFGGEGQSGTGPKAGGPHYVPRFAKATVAAIAVDGLAQKRHALEVDAAKVLPADLPRPPAKAAPDDVEHALTAGYAAADKWARRTAEDRADVLGALGKAIARHSAVLTAALSRDTGRSLADTAGEVVAAKHLIETLAADVRRTLAKPIRLPGPTGEYNELQMHSRGLALVVAAPNGTFGELIGRAAAALGSGNAVIVSVGEEMAAATVLTLNGLLQDSGVLSLLRQPLPDALKLAKRNRVGVVAVAGSLGELAMFAAAMAERPGALVPLIGESAGSGFLARFCNERSLAIDMTAAGGNASLLTLNEDAQAVPIN